MCQRKHPVCIFLQEKDETAQRNVKSPSSSPAQDRFELFGGYSCFRAWIEEGLFARLVPVRRAHRIVGRKFAENADLNGS